MLRVGRKIKLVLLLVLFTLSALVALRLYFSVPLFCYGIWIALTAIPQNPFPFNLMVMAYSFLLMLPLFVTIRIWPQLVWRGRWFFF